MRLVRLLLGHLAGEYPAPSQLRVAVLTCTDHAFERGLERRRVVQDFPFGPAAEAADWFARQRAADVSYALAAPIEDLLGEAAELLAGSRPAGRAPRLLLLSGRGPHPFPRGTEAARACPRRYRWRASLERLTKTARARCVAVTDALPADDAAAAVWDALGPACTSCPRSRRSRWAGTSGCWRFAHSGYRFHCLIRNLTRNEVTSDDSSPGWSPKEDWFVGGDQCAARPPSSPRCISPSSVEGGSQHYWRNDDSTEFMVTASRR